MTCPYCASTDTRISTLIERHWVCFSCLRTWTPGGRNDTRRRRLRRNRTL